MFAEKQVKTISLEITPKTGRKKLHDNILGMFGKIWAKFLCTPKNLLAPTPMVLMFLYS